MRIDVAPIVGVVVLAAAIAGVAAVPQPAAAADSWSDTCVDATAVAPGTHFGSFDRQDRDVLVIDLDEREYATVAIEFTDIGASSRLVVFGLNRFVMEMDDLREKRYFETDESQHPKFYYRHPPDMNFSLSGGDEREYRSADAGKELFARHFVEAHRFPDGHHEFRIDPAIDEPICLVLTDAGDRGSSSWTLSYEEHSISPTGDTPRSSGDDGSRVALRRTLTERNDRIDSLRSTVSRKDARIAQLENRTGGANGSVRTVVKTVRHTTVVERTRVVSRSDPGSPSSAQAPGFTVLPAVVALVALLVLARRR